MNDQVRIYNLERLEQVCPRMKSGGRGDHYGKSVYHMYHIFTSQVQELHHISYVGWAHGGGVMTYHP